MDHRKTFDVVRLYDEAIDWKGSQCQPVEYAEFREISKLAYLEGRRPVLFRYQRLTRKQWLQIVSRATTEDEQRYRAFACGVVEIVTPEAVSWTPTGVEKPTYLAMTEGTIDALERAHGIEWQDMQEIGGVVLTHSRCPFDSAPRYPVQPSSVAVWVAVSRRSAAPSPTDAAPNNTPPVAP